LFAGRSIPAFSEDLLEADIPIWREALFAAELLLLRSSPVYWGFGVPQGDGSAVVLIPGFLKGDSYLSQLHTWLTRIGYRPYFSGIGQNAECPNLLIESAVRETLAMAHEESGRKVHIIGHSLGGLIARAIATQQPQAVASVITLGSPFRGTVAHRIILNAAAEVRRRILEENGPRVLPTCYTGRCTCEFLEALRQELPPSVVETAVYTRSDGIVDWRYCKTDDPAVDIEVPGTHLGLVFNSDAYSVIAKRLKAAQQHAQ
jgi:pimeloyl-ACP methyl ester carboxylesterase